MAHTPPHLLNLPAPTRKVLVPAPPSARTKRARRAEQVDRRQSGHVLASLARVWGPRRQVAQLDPTRAQRPSTRRHGATRHGETT